MYQISIKQDEPSELIISKDETTLSYKDGKVIILDNDETSSPLVKKPSFLKAVQGIVKSYPEVKRVAPERKEEDMDVFDDFFQQS